jgi:hypothetical protein
VSLHAERQRSKSALTLTVAPFGGVGGDDSHLAFLAIKEELAIQRNVEFRSELAGVEWAAGEVTAANLNSRDFALTMVHADDEVFGLGIVFDVHFAELDTTIFQERLCPAAIGTPNGAVDCDGFHRKETDAVTGNPSENLMLQSKTSAPASNYIML